MSGKILDLKEFIINFMIISLSTAAIFPTIDIMQDSVTINTLHFLSSLNILLSLVIFIYCIGKYFKKRFSLFAFNVAFLILLLGKNISNISDDAIWGNFVFQTRTYISFLNEAKGQLCIFLSLLFLFMSYKSKVQFFLNRNNKKNVDSKVDLNMQKVAKYSTYFMYLGGVAAFTKLISKIVYVYIFGYKSIYLSDGAAVFQNPIIDIFDSFYILGFYGYLATFPPKHKLKTPMAIFIIYNVLSLMTGIRGEFVVNTLFLVWYFMKRDETLSEGTQFFTRKRLVALMVAGVFVVVFLFEFGYYRVGNITAESNLFEKILSFANDAGGSGKLVALGLEKSEQVKSYMSPFRIVFHPIYNYLTNNSVVRAITGGALGQSLETLAKAPTFSSILTYITNPDSYFGGGGIGTCYIAEIVVAFGPCFLVLFNYLLGKVFKAFDKIKLGAWGKNVFLFNAFTVLIYIPRQSAMQIIPASVTTMLFIVVVSTISKSGLNIAEIHGGKLT